MLHLHVAHPNRWSAAQVAEEKAKMLEGEYWKARWARNQTREASAIHSLAFQLYECYRLPGYNTSAFTRTPV
jgi:hypothetical protein